MKNPNELSNEQSSEEERGSIDAKVEYLLSRMTSKEKVAQLGSVEIGELMENGDFSSGKAEKILTDGIGQISRAAGASSLKPKDVARVVNKIQKFIEENTRLGIPAIVHEECLSGYMGAGGTTFPQAIGLASSWDPELIRRITIEIRKQLNAIGAHLALSPVLDVARDMRWGRVEETFGEDPYLVASMATSYVKGLQGTEPKEGIYATLKHFGGHGFPEGGRNHGPVNVSPRELRENFLFPFEATVKEVRPSVVMNAYHDIDGIPCAASKEMLTDVLRGEWGFDGIVVSDYYSIRMLQTDHFVAETKQEAGIMALEAGIDVELPKTECYGENLVEAVKEGLVQEATVDEAVRRHLKLKFRKGLFEKRYVDSDKVDSVFETPEQRELAREAVRKSVILMKNEDNLLPLAKDLKSIGVIGPNADSTRNLLGDYAYSAHVESEEDTVRIVSILEGIKNKVSEETEVNYAKGCDVMDESKEGFDEAVKVAEASDVAIVVVGGKSGLSDSDTSGEHRDRSDLELPGVQEELVKSICKTGTPVVVVLVNGRPLSIGWIAENVPAILEVWLPGEEGGNGVADVLFGDYNPSGKLPVSIPRNVGQTPVHYNRKPISYERDYVFIDSKPLFAFGHGLSYTNFKYSNLQIAPKKAKSASEISIKADVENVGDRKGEEVVQLYVRDVVASRTRPIKELKGFKRVALEPGEKRTIAFKLSADQLAFYDRDMNLVVEPGTFKVIIGSSSEDIRLNGDFEITGERKRITWARNYFTATSLE